MQPGAIRPLAATALPRSSSRRVAPCDTDSDVYVCPKFLIITQPLQRSDWKSGELLGFAGARLDIIHCHD